MSQTKVYVGNLRPQNRLVLDHLLTGRNLSPMAARNLYRIERLAARVLELRKDGHIIKTIRCKDATGKTYSMYRLAHVKSNPGVEGIF